MNIPTQIKSLFIIEAAKFMIFPRPRLAEIYSPTKAPAIESEMLSLRQLVIAGIDEGTTTLQKTCHFEAPSCRPVDVLDSGENRDDTGDYGHKERNDNLRIKPDSE